MAGATDVGFSSLFDALERTLVGLVVVLALRGANEFAEFAVEMFGAEIALFLGDPLLQTKMRLDDEFAHREISAWLNRRLALIGAVTWIAEGAARPRGQ